MKDPYTYEGTTILKNKLNIRTEEALSRAEAAFTVSNLLVADDLLDKHTVFDFSYMKKLNKFIFGDLYEFAGIPRTIPIIKRERILAQDTVRYAPPNQIQRQADFAFKELNEINWGKLSLDEKATLFAIQIAKIWQVHPFREGNTRTSITLACQFADRHGFPMDRQIFGNSGSYTRNALVKASDGPYSEYDYLKNIFKTSMEIGLEQSNTYPPDSDINNSNQKKITIEVKKRTSSKNRSFDISL